MFRNMKTVSAVILVLASTLFSVTLATAYETCSDTVISKIKAANGGSFPISVSTSVKLITNKAYSIVWYSDYMVQRDSLTCVTTTFAITGCVDSYVTDCDVTKEVSFKTGFNTTSTTFTITDYEGMDLSAYGVYSGDKCLALYVCSSTGVKAPHVTVYCPTASLSTATSEIEAAKAMLTTVGINDGVELCSETCS